MGTRTGQLQGRRRGRLAGAVAAGLATALTALTVGASPVSAKPSSDSDTPSTTTQAPRPPKQDSSSQDGAGWGSGAQSGGEGRGQGGTRQRNQAPDVDVPSQAAPVTTPAAPPVVQAQETAVPETVVPETKAPQPKIPESAAPSTAAPTTTTAASPSSTVDAPAPTAKVTKAPPSETPAPAPDSTTPARPSTVAAEPTPSAPVVTSVTQSPTTVPTDHPAAEGKPLAELGTSPVAPTRPDVSATATVTTGASTTADRPTSTGREARQLETLKPQTLDAPKADVELANAAPPAELKPAPAQAQDVQDLAKVVNVANFQHDNRADWGRAGDNRQDWNRPDGNRPADTRPDWGRGDDWDRHVRQWRPDWVQYDDYYRPVLTNPYRDTVRVVYIYRNEPRIVYIPPLQRIVMEVADLAAYSFTAVVVNAVNTAVNVAVGSFFGGGYYPGYGMPLPPPPPPVLRYDNVPVQVRYSDAVYQPFRVQRVVDVGDDVQYGEHKVLLDGVTPAWGQWTQNPSGERQFEVHKTQQFPGLDAPREAPLPGDYNLQLVSDQKGMDNRNTYLTIAAVTCGVLSLGAVGLSVYIGRRRREI